MASKKLGSKPAPAAATEGLRRKRRKKPYQQHIEHEGVGHRGTLFTGDWFRLAEAYGGVQALADAVGVSYSTLHRWAVRGDPVPAPCRLALASLAAAKGLPPIPPAGA
jgi:hypothetical protein